MQLLVFEARSENEIDAAFASLVRLHAGALVVASDPFFTQRNEQLVALADFTQPNGILLSPDEKKLYVIDTGFTDGGPSHIRVFDCDIETGKLTNGKVFADGFAPGISDGMRCDVDGNVWCSGVRCYSPSGDLLGKIHLPETCANLVFGGPLRNRLFVCGSTSVYALYMGTQGALK